MTEDDKALVERLRDEDEEIIDSALDTLAWQRREIERLKAVLRRLLREFLTIYSSEYNGNSEEMPEVSDALAVLGVTKDQLWEG